MWLNLAAGVLSIPTTTMPAVHTAGRLALLRSAIQTLAAYRDRRLAAGGDPKWSNHSGRPSMILVAPEYMFLRDGFDLSQDSDLARNRFLEAADVNQILVGLQGLSAEFGRQLVLVPGSIASRRPIPTEAAQAKVAVKAASQQVESGAAYIQGQRIGFPAAERLGVAEAGPWVGRRARPPLAKIVQLRGMLARNRAGQPCYLAGNVAHMLHNGRIVAQYAKRADFHEVLPDYAADDTVFIPGVKSGRATVGGINFGIEICLDHDVGVLVGAPRLTGDLPRIHLICSAAVEPKPASMLVRPGGYLLHASTRPDYTVIARNHPDPLLAPASPENASLGGGTLRMAVIELDILGF